MTVKRWTLLAGTAGLVGGLALGVTGFASAADPTPSPTDSPPGVSGRQGHGPGGLGKGFERRGFRRAGGPLAAVSANSITVRTPSGSKTIGLTSSTTYYSGQTKATKAILSVGDIVGVRLAAPKAASPVATVVTVLPAHLAGFVTKAEGGTITIVDQSGFTRTVRTTSATTYQKDGAPATASVVTVGAFVRTVGAVDADGTTLDATRVSVGTSGKRDAPGRGRGRPMGIPG
ncbi:MAG: hypothetical protein JWM02_3320 [Frankiales bacterium]|nr:hypothetical protein [Frankiales bacterium]